MARRSNDLLGLGIDPAQIGGPLLYGPNMPFETIISIPTGAVVYDTTDGVVKRKVGGYLVDIQYNVIGYGPIADAPVASEALLGSYFIQTDDVAWPSGRLHLYRRGLRNVGTDFVDLGRPSQLVDLFVPANDFTAEILIYPSSFNANRYIVGSASADASLSTAQFAITQLDNGTCPCSINGLTGNIGTLNQSGFSFIRIVKRGAKWRGSINGVWSSEYSYGSYISTTPFFINGRTDGTQANYLGDTCCFRVWAGANEDGSTDNLTPVVNWELDEPAGSAQVIDSVNGLIGTVSDGSPTGYVGNPMLVPDQW